MSSLKQNIAHHRAPESPGLACVSTQAQAPALVIHTWRGESWVLPWSHFSGARLSEIDGNQQLELSFAHYLVALTGENLHALLDDLASFRVASLRDLPPEYRPGAGESTLFVSRIEVRCMSGSEDGGLPTAP